MSRKERETWGTRCQSGAFGGVQDPEGVAAVGPDEQQRVVALFYVGQGLLNIARSLNFVTVDFEDDVALLQSGIVGRTTRLHLFDYSSVDVAWRLKLVPQFWGEVAETDAPVHFAFGLAGVIAAFGGTAAEGFQGDGDSHILAVAKNIERDLRAGLLLSDNHLEFSGIADLLAIDFGNDIADLEASFCAGRIGFCLGDDSANRRFLVKELGVLGRHVGDADADMAVADFAVADQGLDGRPDNLRWNGKSHSGEAAGRRDQESVDADYLTT